MQNIQLLVNHFHLTSAEEGLLGDGSTISTASMELNRTPTNTSDGGAADNSSLSAVYSTSPGTSTRRPSQQLNGRTPSSHSLLASQAQKNLGDVRKGAHAQTTKTSADRSSISMPPPSSKLTNDRRLSANYANSVRSLRRSEDAARSPPSSVKSVDGPYNGSPTAHQSTTAVDPTMVTTASSPDAPGLPVLSPPAFDPSIPNYSHLVSNAPQANGLVTSAPRSENGSLSTTPGQTSKPDAGETAFPARPPRVSQPRSLSSSRRLSTAGSSKNESVTSEVTTPIGRIGVCALDVKARSRPSRQILTRLQGHGDFEVIVFGDKAILDEGMFRPTREEPCS
jgi:hypothetical protein